MEIERAAPTGFCSGVRRAIEMVERASRELGGVESLGEVVHNRQVVECLEDAGVKVVCDLAQAQGPAVAVPSHGAGPQVFREIESRGLKLVDATCPIVRRAQQKAQELHRAGFQVVIFGEGDHPEVKGILAWAGPGARAGTDPQALVGQAKPPRRLGLLSQTTQSPEAFARFVARLSEMALAGMVEMRVVNTTCPNTHLRQRVALELAGRVDLMLVVGGRHSANTRRLAQLCREAGVEAQHIEAAAEIDPLWLRGRGRVGVAAGASTPDRAVEEVMARLRELAET